VLLLGDALLVDRRLAAIQEKTVGRDPLFGAHEVLRGDRVDADAVVTALKTVSLGGTRLVVIRQAEKLREEVQRELASLLDEVPAGTHVVLVADGPDMRRALFARLRQKGLIERLELGAG
jgi:hypothetical protein